MAPKKSLPQWRIWCWSFLGAFVSISVIQILFLYTPAFRERQVPAIVGSFGASAVLAFGAIDSPLAQPRPMIVGHAIASVIGVSFQRLILGLPTFSSQAQAQAVRWVTGALSMAVTLTVTQITKTVHPPAGATALLAIVQDDIVALEWFYIPVILISTCLMVAFAFIFNNFERRYPAFWWTPPSPPSIIPKRPSLQDEERSSSETVTSNWLQENIEKGPGKIVLLSPGHPLVIAPQGILLPEEEEYLNNILIRLEKPETY